MALCDSNLIAICLYNKLFQAVSQGNKLLLERKMNKYAAKRGIFLLELLI